MKGKSMGAPKPELVWIKSSRSAGISACVEFAAEGNWILLRDSKDPGTHLRYTRHEIDAFLYGAKHGEFDHLAHEEA